MRIKATVVWEHMIIHWGGWVLGGSDTHDRLIRELVNGAQVAIVFVNYTPSPWSRHMQLQNGLPKMAKP